MNKLNVADLAKRQSETLAKAGSYHKAKADLHKAAADHHTSHAAFHKGKADAMDDGHEMKSAMVKAHEHHTAKAAHHAELHKLHKGMAEDCDNMKSMWDTLSTAATDPSAPAPVNKTTGADPANPAPAPAAGAPAPAPATNGNGNGDGVAAMINKTTDSLVTKALEALNNDPKVAERIQEIVLGRVNEALGKKVVPDNVHGVLPSVPQAYGSALTPDQIVPRNGAQPIAKTAVPPEFAHLLDE